MGSENLPTDGRNTEPQHEATEEEAMTVEARVETAAKAEAEPGVKAATKAEAQAQAQAQAETATDTTEAEVQPPLEEQRNSAEVVEVDPEPVRPLPPSLRLKSALDSTSSPMNVTSTLPNANWPPKVVADWMTRKIITVEEHELVGNLEEWMQRFKFRHLPVVDADMKLVGLISRTDLLHAELGTMPDGSAAPKFSSDTQAGVIMRRNLVIARLDSPLSTACRVMLDKKLTCLPVVLEGGTLVGILTESDFVRLSLSLLEPKA
jgi:CBS domain-containing membrane protein